MKSVDAKAVAATSAAARSVVAVPMAVFTAVTLATAFTSSFSLADPPIWKVTAAAPNLPVALIRSWPPNLVLSLMFFSSAVSAFISVPMARRSSALEVPLAPWVARSFMR
ncbi:hypothetical protein D3C77_639410 [compost metagenome]